MDIHLIKFFLKRSPRDSYQKFYIYINVKIIEKLVGKDIRMRVCLFVFAVCLVIKTLT